MNLPANLQWLKRCIECSNTYTNPSVQRNRKGRCKACVLKSQREKYASKRSDIGKPVFGFYTLLDKGLKVCTQCKETKTLDYFSRSLKHKYRSSCKACDSLAYAKYEADNKDKINSNRRNRRKNPETAIIFTQRDRQRSLFKTSGKNKSQPATEVIRNWLGCSIFDCIIHIESLFKDGMTWENRGVGECKWQIDHVIPVSLTLLDNNGYMVDTEFNRSIWHYTNLQPLWHIENAKKSNKYEFTKTVRVA